MSCNFAEHILSNLMGVSQMCATSKSNLMGTLQNYTNLFDVDLAVKRIDS